MKYEQKTNATLFSMPVLVCRWKDKAFALSGCDVLFSFEIFFFFLTQQVTLGNNIILMTLLIIVFSKLTRCFLFQILQKASCVLAVSY